MPRVTGGSLEAHRREARARRAVGARAGGNGELREAELFAFDCSRAAFDTRTRT